MEFKDKANKPALKIIPLGGTTTVQKNMYVYECGDEIIVMDCGVGFPDLFTPGVDVIIPDFSYILERREKVKGIVITHGHDDHRSAVPYLLREYKFPVYAAPFVRALIQKSLEEFTNLETYNINAFDPDKSFSLGSFTLHPYRVNHSIPDTLGFAIDTPQGRVFHNTDYKFDWSPVMDKPFDIQKAARLASEPIDGALALLSDCLGSTTDGYSRTERIIEETFDEIISNSTGKQVFITTLSSNISRINQAIQVSLRYGRKIVLAGRSVRDTINIARDFKYIDYPENFFIDEREAHKFPQGQLTYVITGSYGQKGSGLVRVAVGEHKSITLEKNAVVIFSADPIPNAVSAVNVIIDELYIRGAEIYYSQIQDNLHVSGHGLKGDMLLLANVIKPKYFIPIGGNVKHMRAYSELMETMGISPDRVFQLLDGQSVVLKNNQCKLGDKIKLRDVYVDGTIVGDVGTQVLDERIQMANNGMVVITINKDQIEIITRGFVFVKESKSLIEETRREVKKILEKSAGKENKNLPRKIELDLARYLNKKTGRDPLVVVNM